MKPQALVDALKPILERNFAALGFNLQELRISSRTSFDTYVMQGLILCPCGGTEAFSIMLMDSPVVDESVLVTNMAKNILYGTASRKHLEKDIADGTLPPFDIDKHIFKGELI